MEASRFCGPAAGRVNATVSVIGLGYIGLATACILAAAGVRVIGVDVDDDVVKSPARASQAL